MAQEEEVLGKAYDSRLMRRLLTWLRPRWVGRLVPIDQAIDFHKVVGHTLFALSLAHAGTFVFAYLDGHAAAAPWQLLGTARGGTGAALVGIFVVIWVCSLGFIRRSKRFELFYFTHLLYVACTRARDHLLVTSVTPASEFLDDLNV